MKKIITLIFILFLASPLFAQEKNNFEFGIYAEVVDSIRNPQTIILPIPIDGAGFRGLYARGLNSINKNWGFTYEVISADSYNYFLNDTEFVDRKLEARLGFKKSY